MVLKGVTPGQPFPFAPQRVVTGELGTVNGTPQPGRSENSGSVTLELKFKTLQSTPWALRSAWPA